MAQKENRIDFQIGFRKGDTSALESLKKDIAEIQRLASDIDFTGDADIKQIQDMTNAAKTLESALNQAYDVNLNTVNVKKFNQILQQSGYNAELLQEHLATAGITGQQAFLKATGQLMQFNNATKLTNKFLDSIAVSLANTIKWSALSSVVNNITGAVQKSFYYIKDLDRSLNDIRIVTNKSADDMAKFAVEANNAAKALGVSTEDYTQGSLIYYQQGLDDETVKTLTDITAMTSNVTGQAMSAVSEQLTAVWNGYQVANQAAEEGMQVYQEYVDKMAAVGATTASNLEELSTAMSKVASAASSMGVGFDDLNAQIATIVSVTRQAPESVGTALKTIYARLGDLKVDGVDEFGTKLGEVSKQLQTMGINVLDTNGDMRQMTDVMAEVAEKWDTWTSAQKQAAAIAMAGKRQYNNLVALFDNWDMYGEALETSMNAAGTLQSQQEIAMDKLAKKMQVLQTTAEDLYDSLFNVDTITNWVEAGTGALQFLTDFTDAVGGLNNMLPMLGSIGLQVFGNQIGKGLSTIVINTKNAIEQQKIMESNFAEISLKYKDTALFGAAASDPENEVVVQSLQELKDYYTEMYQYQSLMTAEQKKHYNEILDSKVEAKSLAVEVSKSAENWKSAAESLQFIDTTLLDNLEDSKKISAGIKNINDLAKEFEGYLERSSNNIKKLDETDNFSNFSKFINYNKEAFADLGYSVDDIIKKLSSYNGNFEQKLKSLIKELKNIGISASNIDELNQKLKSIETNSKVAGDALRKNLQIQTFVTDITKTIGVIGQLASAISTFKNVGNILNNDDLTDSEKFLQIVTNLSFSIPMLATSLVSLLGNVKKVEGAFKALSTIQSITGLSTKILNDEITREELITTLANKAMEKYAAEKGIDIAAIDAETVALIRKQAAQDADTASLWLNTKAKIANFAATHALAIALVAIPAAIGLVALGVAKLTAAYEEQQVALIRAREEEQRVYLEQKKEKLDEIKQNQELAQSYLDLYAQYKDGAVAKEVMDEKSQSLVDILGEEAVAVATLTGDYEKLTEAMKAQQLESIGERSQANQENLNTLRGNIENKLQNYGNISLQDLGVSENADYEEIFNAFQDFQKLNPDLITTQDIGYITEQLYNMFLLEQDQDLTDITKSLLENENYDLTNLNSYSEFNEVLSSTIKQLQDTGDYDDYNEAFDTAIDIISGLSDNNKDYITRAYATNSLIQKYGEDKREQISNVLKSISNDQLGLVLSADLDWDTFENNLQTFLDKAQNRSIQETIPIRIDLLSNIEDRIANQKGFDDEFKEQFQAEFMHMNIDWDKFWDGFDAKTPIQQLSELNSLIERENKNIYETAKANEEVAEVAPEQVEILTSQLASLNEEYQRLWNTKEHGGLDPQDYEDVSNRLKEIEEEIPEITSELEQWEQYTDLDIDFNDTALDLFTNRVNEIITVAESAKSAAELIGEGFLVAAEDAEQLFKVYPALQDAAEVLANGDIQLNSEIVQSVLDGNAEIITSNTEVTDQQLQQQIDVLQAQITYNKAKMQALSDYLAGEKTAQETEDAINKAGAEYEENLENAVGETAVNNAKLSLDANNQLTDATLKNLDLIGNQANELGQALANALAGKVAGYQASGGGNAGGSVSDYSGYTTSAVGKVWQDNADYAQKAQAEMQRLMTETEDLTTQLANAQLLQSKLRAGSSAALEALYGAGSGKGGKASDKDSGSDQDQKEFEDSYDRYWQIKKAIDAVDHSISVLEKDQKNLHGRELINSLKKENELLAEQQANYEALYELQKQEAAELRGKLSGSSLVFDATGAITNYAQATSEALATYANAVEQYNAGLIDEATLDVQEQAYNNFKKYLERYEELYYSEMQDTEDKIDDARRKQLENNLKGWETEISIKLDLQEAERNWEDFIQEINDDFKSVYKDLNVEMEHLLKKSRTYTGKNGMDGTIGTDLEAMRNVMAEIDKMEGGGFSTMFESVSQAQEKLKELGEQLQDDAKDFHKLWEDAWDTYIDGIDQSADKLEDLMDQFKKLDEELEFQGELIELLYGEEAYGLMNSLYKGQEKSLENQVQAVKAQVDMWKQLFDASGATMENQADWTADQQKYYEQWMDAQSNLNDLVIDYIKLLKTDYLNTIKDTLLTLEKSIAGVRLEDIGTEWERISDYSSKYLDNVEKAYETQKFANKIDQEIASITSLKAQQKLQAFRDKEITQLREKAVLNQYDLDAAEARYEIALKEIALEDAQANKMAMKLTRNEQGNWSYQYIADDEDVANKRQELLDAYNHLYEIASRAYEENLTSLQDLQEKYLESLEEIAELELTDKELAEQRRIELDAWYFEQYQLLAEENEIIRHDLATSGEALLLEVYRQDQEAVQGMTEFERALVQNLIDSNINSYMDLEAKVIANYNNIGDASVELMENTRRDWNSTAQEIAEAWNGDDGASVKGNILAAYDAMIAATEDYKAKVDWCAEASVRNFGPDGITGAINGASTATDALLKSTVDMVKKTTPYLENLRQYVDKIADSWYDVQIAIGDAMSALNEYLAKEISVSMIAFNRDNLATGRPDVYKSSKGTRGNDINSGSTTSSSTPKYTLEHDPFGADESTHELETAQYFGTSTYKHYPTEILGIKDENGMYKFIGTPAELEKYMRENGIKEVEGFYSGGYTGDWTGTDGRMAMLHQKELVLNENDTKNFLDGISMLRDMSSLNGSISNAILNAVAGMAMNLGTLKASGYSGSTTSTVTNGGDTFNITAEFPNANDVNDIREALLSLPNLASQYIGRVAI